ncbi:23422_t:CDS:2, partial [Entrophospora sp. SA101]
MQIDNDNAEMQDNSNNIENIKNENDSYNKFESKNDNDSKDVKIQLTLSTTWKTLEDATTNSDEYLSSFSQSRLKTEILNSFPYNCIPNNFETFINTIDQMENEPLLTSNAKDTHVPPQRFKKSFKENYIKITSYNNLPAIKEENLKLKSSREHYINLHDKFKTLVGCVNNEENYNKLMKKFNEAYLYLKEEKEEKEISDSEIKNPSKPKTKGRPKKRVYNKKSRK